MNKFLFFLIVFTAISGLAQLPIDLKKQAADADAAAFFMAMEDVEAIYHDATSLVKYDAYSDGLKFIDRRMDFISHDNGWKGVLKVFDLIVSRSNPNHAYVFKNEDNVMTRAYKLGENNETIDLSDISNIGSTAAAIQTRYNNEITLVQNWTIYTHKKLLAPNMKPLTDYITQLSEMKGARVTTTDLESSTFFGNGVRVRPNRDGWTEMGSERNYEFDAEEYIKYYNIRDYKGAADYIMRCNISPRKQATANNVMRHLYDKHNKQNAILEGTTLEQREAYMFLASYEDDNILHTTYDRGGNIIKGSQNSYGDAYTIAMNTATNSIGNNIKRLAVTIPMYGYNHESCIDEFFNTLGIDKEDASKYGFNVIRDDELGFSHIDFDLQNKRIADVYKATFAAKSLRFANPVFDSTLEPKDVIASIMNPIDILSKYKTLKALIDGMQPEINRAKYYKKRGYDVGNPFVGNFTNRIAIRPIITDENGQDYIQFEEDASDIVNSIAKPIQEARAIVDGMESQTTTDPITLLHYPSFAHHEIEKMNLSGIFTPSDYEMWIKKADDKIKSILMSGLNHYDVYFNRYGGTDDEYKDTNSKDAILRKATPNERRDLDRMFSAAINSNNYQLTLAYRGDEEYGAYILINPHIASDGSVVGEIVTMFVPGLLANEAKKLANIVNINIKEISLINTDEKNWINLRRQFMSYLGANANMSLTYLRSEQMVSLIDYESKTIYAAKWITSSNAGNGNLHISISKYTEQPHLPKNWWEYFKRHEIFFV